MTNRNSKEFGSVLRIDKGQSIVYQGAEYLVLKIVDLEQIFVREKKTSVKKIIKVSDLKTAHISLEAPLELEGIDLEAIDDHDWDIATFRSKLLEPLLQNPKKRKRGDYIIAAKRAQVSPMTLYRWLNAYEKDRKLSSLLPKRRSGGKNKSRLSLDVQTVVDEFIQNIYLKIQRPSKAFAASEIRRLCYEKGIKNLPSYTTVSRHIDWISEKEKVLKRDGRKALEKTFGINEGSIPDANWPLAIVQIDHTPLDVIIVDDVHRKPINRPWITVAIDVFSRVVLGMYISLDAPSSMSAGMCLSHCILTKGEWLKDLGFGEEVEWPFWGVMDVLHMDNAAEFRSETLKALAKEYLFDLNLRPIAKPRYGGHIESMMGTIATALKVLPGATFSNIKEKDEYPSAKMANMTFSELEQWLVLQFATYHLKTHESLGMSPREKWKQGILGDKNNLGRGLPEIRLDKEKVRIDFLPYEERTIQPDGVSFEGIWYFSDILRDWVGYKDPDMPSKKISFKFRYDPRDLSQLYFFEPKTSRYYPIRYRDSRHFPISLWELKASKKTLKEQGKENNEIEIFNLITMQREIEEGAANATLDARRKQQRLKVHEKARHKKKSALPNVHADLNTNSILSPKLKGYNPDEIEALDDDY